MNVIRHVEVSRAVALLAAFMLALAPAACTDAPVAEARQESSPESAEESASSVTAVTLSGDEMRAGGIAVGIPRQGIRTNSVSASAVLQVDESRTARLGSVVDGVVVDVRVQAGTRVTRGARLATIDSHAVHEARAEYRRAMADRRRAMTELTYVAEAEARAARLLTAKAASRQEVERARTDRAVAEESLVIAESEVRRALDGLEHLGIPADPDAPDDAGNAVPVMATIGGVVLERLVTPGTAVTAGTPLFVISDLSHLWAVAEIDEAMLPAVAVGRTAELTVTAYPERTFEGRIVAIGDTVNPDTRRVTARIALLNADGSLKPQMFATARLAGAEQDRVLLVPAAAVQKVDQQAVVFVEDEPGRFVQRQVTVGLQRDGDIEIRHGLSASERVATSGTFLLKSKFLEAGLPE